jgi:hypothetical protein
MRHVDPREREDAARLSCLFILIAVMIAFGYALARLIEG